MGEEASRRRVSDFLVIVVSFLAVQLSLDAVCHGQHVKRKPIGHGTCEPIHKSRINLKSQ
jgi:hypothetical protein